MSSITVMHFLGFMMLAAIVVGLLAVLGIVIMHFLTPKRLIDKYFRDPYFSMTEPAYFMGRVYSINFTVMFMTACAFPRMGKKRKMTEVYKEMPKWYRIASRILLIIVLSCCAVFVIFAVYGFFT